MNRSIVIIDAKNKALFEEKALTLRSSVARLKRWWYSEWIGRIDSYYRGMDRLEKFIGYEGEVPPVPLPLYLSLKFRLKLSLKLERRVKEGLDPPILRLIDKCGL